MSKRWALFFLGIAIVLFSFVYYNTYIVEKTLDIEIVTLKQNYISGLPLDETVIKEYPDGRSYGNLYMNYSVYEECGQKENPNPYNDTKITKHCFKGYRVKKIGYGLITEGQVIQRTKGDKEVKIKE